MSLTGNLEDLALADIMQIISLSKRTGILEIQAEDRRRGVIVFKNGQIASALLSGRGSRTLGEYLVQLGYITQDQLNAALEVQRVQFPRQPLGQILVQKGWISRADLELMIKQQIYRTVYELLQITSGTFRFHITEIIPYDEIRVDPIDLILLEKGLNTQQVILDALKLQDEQKRRVQVASAEPAAGPTPEPAKSPAPAPPADTAAVETTLNLSGIAVIVCIQHPVLRTYLKEFLFQRDAVVVEPSAWNTHAILERIGEWRRLPVRIVVILDAGVLDHPQAFFDAMAQKYPDLDILLLYRHLSPELEPYLQRRPHWRPVQIPIVSGTMQARHVHLIIESLMDPLREIVERLQTPVLSPKEALVARLCQELGLEEMLPAETMHDRLHRILGQLKSALQELRDPMETPMISLLILQFAAEFLDRGILLLNTSEGLTGLGGFGETGDDEAMPIKVRRVRFPRPVGDFLQVIEHRQTVRRDRIDLAPWLETFLHMIGRYRPTAYVIMPILVQKRAIALLYGDNAVTRKPLGDLSYLEIFLHQAGFAIENAILTKRMSEAVFR